MLSLMEIMVNAVSTRKVTRIADELCGAAFSKSTVGQLRVSLDGRYARDVALYVRFPASRLDLIQRKGHLITPYGQVTTPHKIRQLRSYALRPPIYTAIRPIRPVAP